MSGNDPEDERRWSDGPVGNAPTPLSEPWFLREARERRAQAAASASHEPPTVATPVAPTEPPVVAADAPRGPWRIAMIVALASIAAIVLLLAVIPKSGGAPPVEPLAEDGADVSSGALDCASPATIARLREIVVGQARAGGGDPEARAAGLSVSVAGPPTPPPAMAGPWLVAAR